MFNTKSVPSFLQIIQNLQFTYCKIHTVIAETLIATVNRLFRFVDEIYLYTKVLYS
jgi:hypothetical protein